MEKYKVMLYPKAFRDIDSIYAYIALEKLAPENASFKDPSMSLVLDSETAIRIFLANADGTKLNADDVTVSVTPPTGITWNAETQLQKTQKGNRVMDVIPEGVQPVLYVEGGLQEVELLVLVDHLLCQAEGV